MKPKTYCIYYHINCGEGECWKIAERENKTSMVIKCICDGDTKRCDFEKVGNARETAKLKHGHWIYDGCYEMGGLPKCSSCGRRSHSGAYGDEDGYCPHCGAKMDEVVDACMAMATDESKPQLKPKTVPIVDCLPPCGVPLMVHTRDNLNGGAVSVKYPVYYAKDPYSLTWEWWFFPAMEGMAVLLPEYSEVIEWQEIT